MPPGDLDVSLLWKIMSKVGESRSQRNALTPGYTIETRELMNLVPPEVGGGPRALGYLDRHVDYLRDDGFLKATAPVPYRSLGLTIKGQKFVQQELAQFGQEPMLPRVVKSLENRIQILTYPQKEKEGMLYSLREAIGKDAPDFIADVIVKIAAKLVTG